MGKCATLLTNPVPVEMQPQIIHLIPHVCNVPTHHQSEHRTLCDIITGHAAREELTLQSKRLDQYLCQWLHSQPAVQMHPTPLDEEPVKQSHVIDNLSSTAVQLQSIYSLQVDAYESTLYIGSHIFSTWECMQYSIQG